MATIRGPRIRQCVFLALGCLLTPLATLAQVEFGGLYGNVRDVDGGPLPGVTLSLTGPGATLLQQSDPQGNFRFPRLDPGLYGLTAELDGFSPLEHEGIDVRAGRNTTLALQVSAAVEDAITVVGEAPLLDDRKLAQGALLTETDLERIPTAGDVHALLNQAPGVLVDRLDVGGSRQPAAVVAVAPGVGRTQTDFLIDGVQVTDMGGGGQALAFFDVEQYEQVEFATGGNDISKATAGVSVNLVTQRGTNELRGSARYSVLDEGLQSSPDLDPGDFPPEQGTTVEATRINRVTNWGLDLGGPVLRDRLWFWGSHTRSDYSATAVGGFPRDDVITASALKLNAQAGDSTSVLASWNNSLKENDGDADFFTSPEASLRLEAGSGIPLWKVEVSHVLGSNLFLTGTFAHFDSGFAEIANGCVAAGGCDRAPEALIDANGVFQNSFESGSTERPITEWKVDGSYFFASEPLSHELKFGARLREFEVRSDLAWPGGRNLFHAAGEAFFFPPGTGLFLAQRGSVPPVSLDYTSVWIQDVVTSGPWTASAGLRYDLQQGENEPFVTPANPAFPELLPAVTFDGNDGGFDWETVSPRLGLTYAVGSERQTLLRASYSRFPRALTAGPVVRVNPAGVAQALFFFVDLDDDDIWSGPQEPFEFIDFGGFDPRDPTALSTPNRNDPGLDPELTDELVLGVEHAFRPELVAGLHLTWRRTSDILEERELVRDPETGSERTARREDYSFAESREVTQPGGRPYVIDIWELDPELARTGGSLLLNGDREVEYLGASVSVTKRLSGGWMLRGHANYGKPEWDIPASFFAFRNPTDRDAFDTRGFDNDGDIFGQGAGRFNRLLLQSTWSINVNGMVQIAPERPWGFNLAGNVYGREGYPLPLFARDATAGPVQAMATADDFRYDDLWTVDLRIEKEIQAPRRSSVTLIADVFNVFNEGTVLERGRDVAFPSFVLETASPRIWRLGVRFDWR